MVILTTDAWGRCEVHKVVSIGYDDELAALYFKTANNEFFYNENITAAETDKICRELYSCGKCDISKHGETVSCDYYEEEEEEEDYDEDEDDEDDEDENDDEDG